LQVHPTHPTDAFQVHSTVSFLPVVRPTITPFRAYAKHSAVAVIILSAGKQKKT